MLLVSLYDMSHFSDWIFRPICFSDPSTESLLTLYYSAFLQFSICQNLTISIVTVLDIADYPLLSMQQGEV